MNLYMDASVCIFHSQIVIISSLIRIKHMYTNSLAVPVSLISKAVPVIGHKTLKHKVIDSVLYRDYSNFFQHLSQPSTTIFFLPATRVNSRNILNLLQIDFPPEFTLLLKIQGIRKGDRFHTNNIYRYTPYLLNMPAEFAFIVHVHAFTTCKDLETFFFFLIAFGI